MAEAYTINNDTLAEVLPTVLFEGGLEPAADRYPDYDALIQRHARVAVERAVAFIPPRYVSTLKTVYEHAPNTIMEPHRYAAIRGWTVQTAACDISDARREVKSRGQRIIEGTFSYATGGDRKLLLSRYNVLSFAGKIALPMKPTDSVGELLVAANRHLETTFTLSDKERSIVRRLYRLDGMHAESFSEIGEAYGYSATSVSNLASKAIQHLAVEPGAIELPEAIEVPEAVETIAESESEFPLMPKDDPRLALQLMRNALRGGNINLNGKRRERTNDYVDLLQQTIREKPGLPNMLAKLKYNTIGAIRVVYNTMNRYAALSNTPMNGYFDRDVAIVERYLRDVIVFEVNNMSTAAQIAMYLSPEELYGLYAANPDIPEKRINKIIETSRLDPWRGVVDYRTSLAEPPSTN